MGELVQAEPPTVSPSPERTVTSGVPQNVLGRSAMFIQPVSSATGGVLLDPFMTVDGPWSNVTIRDRWD
jgi:hypothetical protein